MAFTSSSVKVRPISVVGPRYAAGGKRQAVTRTYRVNASQTLIKGDLCVLSSGKVTKGANNFDSNTANLVGVAAQDKTTGASPSESDIIVVYDAAANFFEANLVASETADGDMTDRSDWNTGRPLAFVDAVPAPTTGQWVILDISATNDDAKIVALSPNQQTFDHGDKTSPNLDVGNGITSVAKVGDKFPISGAHTGILNARVIFVFRTVSSILDIPAVS